MLRAVGLTVNCLLTAALPPSPSLPLLSLYVIQARGRILGPSSCATLTDRSPWSFFASHVTFCAVAAVTCPPTKTTGQSSDAQHKDTAEKG